MDDQDASLFHPENLWNISSPSATVIPWLQQLRGCWENPTALSVQVASNASSYHHAIFMLDMSKPLFMTYIYIYVYIYIYMYIYILYWYAGEFLHSIGKAHIFPNPEQVILKALIWYCQIEALNIDSNEYWVKEGFQNPLQQVCFNENAWVCIVCMSACYRMVSTQMIWCVSDIIR